MSEVVYIDTSALAKWYLNEDRSADVEAFLTKTGPAAVSTLTLVEMRSLLARRRRVDARSAWCEGMGRGWVLAGTTRATGRPRRVMTRSPSSLRTTSIRPSTWRVSRMESFFKGNLAGPRAPCATS